FEQLRNRGQVPVLLVDDVQTLPPTSLITLLRLYERQVGGAPLVSLVLFADEQIDMLLSTPQLQIMSPQAIQAIDLPPLTRDEAGRFMDFLLRTEGLPESLRLDESKLTRLHRETRGIPGPLASAILNAVGEEGETPVASGSRRLSPSLLFGGVAAVIVLGLLLMFQGPINRMFQPPAASGTKTLPADRAAVSAAQEERHTVDRGEHAAIGAPVDQAPPSASQQSTATATPPAAQSAAAGMAETPPETAAIPIPKPAGTATDAGQSKVPPAEQLASENASMEPATADSANVARSNPGPEPAASEVPGEAVSAAKEKATPQPAPRDTPATESEATTAKKAPDVEAVTPAVAPAKVAQAPAKSPPAKTNAKPVAESNAGFMKSHEWLLSQAPDQYTIQLLAVENFESIQAYIKHHPLASEAFTLQITRKGKPWYPLLWRVFPNKAAATAAISQLPPEIRKSGAWARSFASLQK
ncbi:MAG: SPOR domain-containing protein, partial [Candidatus Thiodiazotropha sp.]